jgi:hypothetical protein
VIGESTSNNDEYGGEEWNKMLQLLGDDNDEQRRTFEVIWPKFMAQRNLSTQVDLLPRTTVWSATNSPFADTGLATKDQWCTP